VNVVRPASRDSPLLVPTKRAWVRQMDFTNNGYPLMSTSHQP
jgi:hypothetical protein